MKNNFLNIYALLLGFTLVACLDDDKYALDPSGSHNVVEFVDPSNSHAPAGAVYQVWTETTELAATYTFKQTIKYAGAKNTTDKAIELTVEVDQGVLDEYNEQMITKLHSGTYEMMPATFYDFPKKTVVIPKGQSSVEFEITVKPDQFNLTKSYALPLRITSTTQGVLSEHFSAGLFNVVVKNLYDGVYKITSGNIVRYTGGGAVENPTTLGGPFPASGSVTFTFTTKDDDETTIAPKWVDNSAVGGVGGLVVKVNAAGAPPAGAPAGSKPISYTCVDTPNLTSIAGSVNYYDPATHTFFMNFVWTGASGKREMVNVNAVYKESR